MQREAIPENQDYHEGTTPLHLTPHLPASQKFLFWEIPWMDQIWLEEKVPEVPNCQTIEIYWFKPAFWIVPRNLLATSAKPEE